MRRSGRGDSALSRVLDEIEADQALSRVLDEIEASLDKAEEDVFLLRFSATPIKDLSLLLGRLGRIQVKLDTQCQGASSISGLKARKKKQTKRALALSEQTEAVYSEVRAQRREHATPVSKDDAWERIQNRDRDGYYYFNQLTGESRESTEYESTVHSPTLDRHLADPANFELTQSVIQKAFDFSKNKLKALPMLRVAQGAFLLLLLSYCWFRLQYGQCIAGYIPSEGSSFFCQSCQPGTYSSSGSNSCFPCSAGLYAPAASAECSPCERGTYSDKSSGSCFNCEPGKHRPTRTSGPCKFCALLTVPDSVGVKCINCKAGRFSKLGGASCLQCEEGTFRGARDKECRDCPAMTYHSKKRDKCLQCPAGSTSLTKSAKCAACAAGFYREVGMPSCTKCSKGYISHEGAVSSSECKVESVIDAVSGNLREGAIGGAIGAVGSFVAARVKSGFGGLLKSLCERLFGEGYCSGASFWQKHREERYDFSDYPEPENEGCIFKNEAHFTEWFQKRDLLQQLNSPFTTCKQAKKLARKLFIKYHPDKIKNLYPDCSMKISTGAVAALNAKLDSKCK